MNRREVLEKQLRTLIALTKNSGSVSSTCPQHSNGSSQSPVLIVTGDLIYQACTWYTYTHAGKHSYI